MSKVRTNALSANGAEPPVPIADLKLGHCAAWAALGAGTDGYLVRDGFNISSTTDGGFRVDITITNAMTDNTYACPGSCTGGWSRGRHMGFSYNTADGWFGFGRYLDDATNADNFYSHSGIIGILA